MKFKFISLIAGAVAIAFLATPLGAKAQDTSSGPSPGVTQPTQHHSPYADLNLTQQQQDQLAQIKSDTHSRINQVLTSDQQNQLQAAIQAGQKRGEAFKSLNLSQEQMTQIKQIWQSSRQQMRAVLTPEQQQQLRAKAQQWHQERQQVPAQQQNQ